MQFPATLVKLPDCQMNWEALTSLVNREKLNIRRPVCILNHTSITLTSGVAASVPWDTEISDPFAMHTASATTVTVPYNGIYDVSVGSQLQAGVPAGASTWTGIVLITGAHSGQTPPNWVTLVTGGVGFNYADSSAGGVLLDAGDTLALQLSQNIGVNKNAVSSFMSVSLTHFI